MTAITPYTVSKVCSDTQLGFVRFWWLFIKVIFHPKSWTIAKVLKMARRVDKAFSYMKKHAESMRFERTGLIPVCKEDYTSLKTWYKKQADEYKEKKMQQNVHDLEIAKEQNRELARVFGGKTIGDGNVGILGLPTVWARNWNPTDAHPLAPWPSPREFREEGDERYTSNYGRYMPIPRVPGNPTVVYKQKSWNPVEPLDMVMPVPKLYGNVNINKLGYFDATVDEEGIPYDDEELPGKEYFVEQNNHTRQNNSVGHSLWSGDTKVNSVDRNAHLHMNATPTRKPRFSRFRAEAVPFVARKFDGKDVKTSNDYSKIHMKGSPEEKKEASTASIGALLESTNIDLQPKADAGLGSFGYIGMERKNGILENDPFIDSHFKELRGNDSTTKGKESLADFFACKAELRPKAMLQSPSDAIFRIANPVQPGLKWSIPQNDSVMGTNLNKVQSGSGIGLQSQTYDIKIPAPSFGVAKSFGLHKSASFSSRSRFNKPAALKLDKTYPAEFVISAMANTQDTNGGVKLDAATELA